MRRRCWRGTAGVALIAVLGGDGMMMRAARMFPDVPLLGINFGHVGFLTMVERNDWRHALELVLAADYRIQRGPTLRVELVRDGRLVEWGPVINDAVIRAGPQLIEVEVYINGQYVNIYPGDGMIVSTPRAAPPTACRRAARSSRTGSAASSSSRSTRTPRSASRW